MKNIRTIIIGVSFLMFAAFIAAFLQKQVPFASIINQIGYDNIMNDADGVFRLYPSTQNRGITMVPASVIKQFSYLSKLGEPIGIDTYDNPYIKIFRARTFDHPYIVKIFPSQQMAEVECQKSSTIYVTNRIVIQE